MPAPVNNFDLLFERHYELFLRIVRANAASYREEIGPSTLGQKVALYILERPYEEEIENWPGFLHTLCLRIIHDRSRYDKRAKRSAKGDRLGLDEIFTTRMDDYTDAEIEVQVDIALDVLTPLQQEIALLRFGFIPPVPRIDVADLLNIKKKEVGSEELKIKAKWKRFQEDS